MNQLSRLHVVAAIAISSFSVTGVVAQSEKIALRMAPAPDQTVRMTMAQDMDMELIADSAGALPGLTAPLKMVMRTTMDVTQKVGARKPDGSVDAEITYDQVKVEMTMNGQTLPTSVPSGFSTMKVTVTYNRNGEIVDVKGLPDTGAIPADTFKQMMSSFYGNLPAEPVGVGETASVPINFTLPLPIPGASAMKMAGDTKMKFVSLDRDDAGNRAARLEAALDGKMTGDFPSPDGKNSMRLDFLLKGSGTTVMDLTRGVLRSAISSTTIDGKLEMGTGAPVAVQPMRMHATMTVTMASN